MPRYINKAKYNSRYGEILQALEDYRIQTDRKLRNKISWELYMNILKWIDKEVEQNTI